MPPKKQKKAPVKPYSDSESEEEFVSASTDTKMDPADFIYCLKAALLDQDISQQLQACLSPVVTELKKEIDELRDDIKKRDNEITKLHEEIDELKQGTRCRTLLFDGLEEESGNMMVEDNVSQFVTNNLNIPLDVCELENCFRVGKKENNKSRRIIVQLHNLGKVKKILGAKQNLRKLKDQTVYINQDLIPKRAEIHKTARQHVKTKKLYRTWIYNGQVHVKMNESDQDSLIVKSLSYLNMLVAGK